MPISEAHRWVAAMRIAQAKQNLDKDMDDEPFPELGPGDLDAVYAQLDEAMAALNAIPSTDPVTVTILAIGDAHEAGAVQGGVRLTRTPLGNEWSSLIYQPLTVNLSIGGTATPGSDYQALPATLLIPDGQASADMPVTPFDDLEVETDETVAVTLLPGTGYVVGSPDSAEIKVLSDDIAPPPEPDVAAFKSAGEGFGFNVSKSSWVKTGVFNFQGTVVSDPSPIFQDGTPNSHILAIQTLTDKWDFAVEHPALVNKALTVDIFLAATGFGPLYGPGFWFHPLLAIAPGGPYSFLLPNPMMLGGAAVAGSSYDTTLKRLRLWIPPQPTAYRRVVQDVPYTDALLAADLASAAWAGKVSVLSMGPDLDGDPINLYAIGSGPVAILNVMHHVQEDKALWGLRAMIHELATGARLGTAWASAARANFTWHFYLGHRRSHGMGNNRACPEGFQQNRYGINVTERAEGRVQNRLSLHIAGQQASPVKYKIAVDLHSAPNSGGGGNGLFLKTPPGSPLNGMPFTYNPGGVWSALPSSYTATTWTAIDNAGPGGAGNPNYHKPPVPSDELVGMFVPRIKARHPEIHTAILDCGEHYLTNGQWATQAIWETGTVGLLKAEADKAPSL
jgi:hypothetical protein